MTSGMSQSQCDLRIHGHKKLCLDFIQSVITAFRTLCWKENNAYLLVFISRKISSHLNLRFSFTYIKKKI